MQIDKTKLSPRECQRRLRLQLFMYCGEPGHYVNKCDMRAVLSQRASTDGKIHPCAFFSRKISPTEWKYNVGNRELLAIKMALEEWRQWLEGAKHPFIVWTDHQNLAYLQTTRWFNPPQARWSLFFTRFQFSITYRPGSHNVKPDSLSRLFSEIEERESVLNTSFAPIVSLVF